MSSEPIGYRHNPCAECGKQVDPPAVRLCLDCICRNMDECGMSMQDAARSIIEYESADRRRPYATNPARRLRRIRRWMAMGGYIPDAHMMYRRSATGPETEEAASARYERTSALAHGLADEFAWAVETAAKAIGSKP